MAALLRQGANEILPTTLPGERGPEFSVERPAAERRVETPAADRHDHVGIDERAGEVERPRILVGREVGRVGHDGGIEFVNAPRAAQRCWRFCRRGRPSDRLERRGVEQRDVVRRDAGRGDLRDHGRRHGGHLRHVTGKRDRHAVPRHHMGGQRRTGRWISDRPAHELRGRRRGGALRPEAIGHEGRHLHVERERIRATIVECDACPFHGQHLTQCGRQNGSMIRTIGMAPPVCAVVQLPARSATKHPVWIVVTRHCLPWSLVRCELSAPPLPSS